MSLMAQVKELAVAKDSIAMWWLGQNGFLFKSAEGTVVGVDLYLTDSCSSLPVAINLKRQIPVFVEPEDLVVDLFACTHNHQDHTDPETIARLRNKDTSTFAGPHPTCDIYRNKNIESGRIAPTWPDSVLEFRDARLTGTFALPTDSTDLNHMGFVVQFGRGPKVYITGDTADHELVASAAKHSPDAMISCINGGFNNMSAWEAAGLAAKVRPRIAIPCHYDMFPDNSADPEQFRATLAIRAPESKYQKLVHGQPFVLQSA